ncbi:hypothetical protein K1T71_010666 [Dendrolimus kikuchii]|uniref:Uncharacterized protein n=1 Tax=Dendrolimus kikuchii TaxID=765133 RepID=A0ACC1CPW9_9NEOP|nr:hypothetical protein K1T71_010666 [Dendrolimus kikuchii]
MIFNIQGVLAPVFAPVDEKGNINFDIIPRYAQFLNNSGINGILVGGTTGEAVTMTVKERNDLLEAWVKTARPLDMKVIAQIGGVPLPDIVEMAKFAQEVHADAIMTLPELYYKPRTVEHLVSYLAVVAKAAPSLPLIYYHFPMMSGVDVNMSEFLTLASSRIPTFKGMKADLGVAVQVADQLAADQRIFIANHQIAPAVLMGHESSIATVTNIFPELVQSIVEAVKSGDVFQAKIQQEHLNRLVNIITSHGDFVPSMKEAMELVTGIAMGPPRLPLLPLGESSKKSVADNLKALNVKTFSP